MQPYGVPVADEYYGPTGAFRGTETCDVAGYLWSQIVLLTVSGQGRLADRAERAFFNAGPATVSRDFKHPRLLPEPQPHRRQLPALSPRARASGCSYKQRTFPLCCTAALNRIVPNYVMHMWMATYDNGLAATLLRPLQGLAPWRPTACPSRSYAGPTTPSTRSIEMAVKPAREATFPLSFRIPGWCRNPELSVNGLAVNGRARRQGFVRLERLWKAGRHDPPAVSDVGERADGARR